MNKKIQRFLLIICLLAVFFLFGAVVQAQVGSRDIAEAAGSASNANSVVTPNASKQDLITVDVAPGDTLWAIAKENAPSNTDVRSYIDKIMKKNHLRNSQLKVGQTLVLP